METVLKIAVFLYVAISLINAHNSKELNDADMQSALMPQELNPVFVSDTDKPWRSILPLPRVRRNSEMTVLPDSTMAQVRSYSRIVAYAVLAISAVIELVVWAVESYYG